MLSNPLILSTAASALFLLLLPFRLSKLRKETIKVIPEQHGHGKVTLAIILVVAQSVILATTALSTSRLGIDLASAIVSLIAYVGLCPLLKLEHTRSVRPSDLAVVYLLVSSGCELVDLGTGVFDNESAIIVAPALASLFVKGVLLVVEIRGKHAILQGLRDQWSPEELSSILDRTVFGWINPLLVRGNKYILTGDCLPTMDSKLSSQLRRQRALEAWDQRDKPEKKLTLPRVLLLSMLPQFLAPIVPRLVLVGFRYAQPVLIGTAIRSINKSSEESSDGGYSVVPMAVVVYVGLAISRAAYQHRLNRLKVMIRGAVVGLLNNKSLNKQSAGYDDARAVTLMSTDADNVVQSASMFHETWAQIIEVALGTVMLARRVGWVCAVPFVMIFFCSRVSRYLAKNLQSKHKDWSVATHNRIAMTTSMLGSVKSLKMLGIVAYTESLILSLRLRELDMAKKVRWMMVAYNASANALGIFAPILTLVLYVIVARLNGSALDVETAFTTTALLGLVTHPANMIMTIVPQAVGSLAAFERIQQYLAEPPRDDQRLLFDKAENSLVDISPAVSLKDVTIQGLTPSKPPVLSNLNFVIDKGSIVMCSGPVGSGKTTLVRALLGEVPTAFGTVSVSTKRIGYCEQSPWLQSGTLSQAVRGFLPEETSWYQEVIQLCCLDEDLLALPNGDNTMIGSRGLNLSGGQRQRVALARAIYARSEIVILDDSFSALDGKTESRVVESLFGSAGHFKKTGTTVFLVTHSTAHFHLADQLVVLGGGAIAYQGTWDGLKQNSKYASLKVDIDETKNDTVVEQPQVDKTVQNQKLKMAEAASDLSRATGDFSLYGYYFRAIGLRHILILLTCSSTYSFFVTFPQYWLQKWTEAPVSQTTFYIGGYLISSLLAWIATSALMWTAQILIAPASGIELHRRLLSTIIGAPLSYFSKTDTGVTLNRFGQDIQLVDRQLPPAIMSMSVQVFKLLVQVVLLLSAQKMLALTLPLCAAVVYLVQRVYLRTSRQLRLLDLESQSAVYSSFLESVEGVMTIRAFGWEKQAEHANVVCLDKSQKPAYILFCLQQWLGIVLDLMVAAIATGLITIAVYVRGTTTAGQIGMALNIVLVANATFLSLVTSWTNMEISLGAISRLKTLEADTPKEDQPHEDFTEAWPSSGAVEFDKVTVSYNSDSVALQDITMKVSPGQQLIVCGRTGSGKSTMLLTLLRLLDTVAGSIKVDGVDLRLVPRSLIRQKCFITVSQDSFILGHASLRFNLDPSTSLPDETIIPALERFGLLSHFHLRDTPSEEETRNTLDSPLSSLPQISTGQSQLFALARALVQLQSINHSFNPSANGTERQDVMPILLLDEATSSLDTETESAIRDIIHQEFTEKGHTVIAITHRLGGVTEGMRPGRDAVVLLSKGKIEKLGQAGDVLDLATLRE
ncbi:P-loop containing nucleoside triphosphate hydrolase protein [Colletotrichum phormii]|uniref:P-loop containing nucleoside triphosphate hydrolase protein n=1 Tax=Colletotrichum phormii TaxID=359342 RepID=A0AAI9ZYN0_9PEZI|nr:P-loop containing nucleoside triphosphate hydrolase protein [Colletotrichum phormii]KAK1639348.1 P-loop containing nucleoside triphosphate hydrolase protein [Colletotrichum phormii]